MFFDPFDPDFDPEEPWTIGQWLFIVFAVGMLALVVFSPKYHHEIPQKNTVEQKESQPIPVVQYTYRLTPQEFAELEYRKAIQEIDRQVDERIKNNHKDDPK